MHTKKFLTSIKGHLLQEKQERLRRSAQKVEIDIDGDETDEIQGAIQIGLHQQMASINKARLSMIEEALGRIANGTYGKCADCEEKIPEKRLQINPYCLTCISCAEDRELESKRNGG
jgi:DnaK suppressor protein